MSVFKGAAAAVVNSYDKYPRLNAPYSYLLQVESMKSVVSRNPATLGTIYVITEFKVVDTNDPSPSHQTGCHVSETIGNAGKQAPYFLPELKNLISKILRFKESDLEYKQYLSNESPAPSSPGMTVTEAFFTSCCGEAQPLAKHFVAARVTEQSKRGGEAFAKAGWHIVPNPNTWRETELGGLTENVPTFPLPTAMGHASPPVPSHALPPLAPAMTPPALPQAAPPALPPAPPPAPWEPKNGWIFHPGNPAGNTDWCFNTTTNENKLTKELRVAQGG